MSNPTLNAFKQAFREGDAKADLNGDGKVDLLDLAVLKQHRSSSEPGAEALCDGCTNAGQVTPTAANAQVFVWLTPSTTSGVVGEALTFDVHMDFTADRTFGGSFDVTLSGGTGVFSWSFDSSDIGDDPGFRRQPIVTPLGLRNVTVASFDGMTGPGVIGTLTVTPNFAGSETLDMRDGATTPWVSWTTGQVQNPTYTGASLDVVPGQAVPLGSGAVWLLGAALMAAAATRGRRVPAAAFRSR